MNSKTVKMVETLGIRPWRQSFLPQLHESFLEFRYRLRRIRIARRYYATLTRIMAKKFNVADLKRLQLPRRAKQLILTKGLFPKQLQICAKTPARAFET